MKGYTYAAIGAAIDPPMTKQGVRFALLFSDRFYDLKLGSFKHFQKFRKKMKVPYVQGDKSVQSSKKTTSGLAQHAN